MCSPEDKECIEAHKSPNLPLWVSILHHGAQRVAVRPNLSAHDLLCALQAAEQICLHLVQIPQPHSLNLFCATYNTV